MGILAWLVLGAIAGFVANRLVGGHGGLIGTVVLGIAGGLVGGFAASQLFHNSVDGLNLDSLLIAIAGAIVVLFAWRHLTAGRTRWLRL
jgi:uncharacterized membrane protein YeaQ/YmgE (transglycosylase-associated protein family)